MGRSRISKTFALLALLSSSSAAVKLADFAPLITNLTPTCQAVYSTAISGCKVTDFTNTAHTCSQACLSGLVQINAVVNRDCVRDDVSETSIIGLFLLGQAIQLLCNVAVVTTTTGAGTATVGTSTLLLSSVSTVTSGLLTDTSVVATPKKSTVSVKPTTTSTTSTMPSLTSTSNGVIGESPTSVAASSTSSTSSTGAIISLSPAATESQRSGNTNSGGGSPFDNIDNSGAAESRTLSAMVGSMIVASICVAVLGLR